MPAYQNGIAEKLCNGLKLSSMAFCLEDTIPDGQLEQAEEKLYHTLSELIMKSDSIKEMPLIFIRVRNSEHIRHVLDKYKPVSDIVTGLILPKFDMDNAFDYLSAIRNYNAENPRKMYAMPILESGSIAELKGRADRLHEIKLAADEYADLILNIRVGGNDLCNLFGLRRSQESSIYDIGVIRNILSDIINVFSADYVVSGPVYEYYGGGLDGLRRELELDRINGFIGKTAIHPSQLDIINESLKPLRSDYNDALSILDQGESGSAVFGSFDGTRMNETRCHSRWAKKILILASVYGVKEDT